MAESLTREGPIDVLESAVRVLRQAGVSTLVLHWAGSVPFALATLVFWKQVTNPHISDAACALDALALTAMLVWMNCWRAVFAGSVRRQLNGDLERPRTRGELFRLIMVQSLACGTKLIVLPLTALIVFPLPVVIAFYRNVAALADRQEMDTRATFARARQLARVQPETSWLTIPLLLFLGLVVCLNMVVVIGAAPQLIRILTGYESTFSRSGAYFVTNPMFMMLVLSSTWILFDPFVQTVYCLRCYQAEARETGEDVRAGIRRLHESVVLAMLALIAIALPCRADVPPTTLQKAAETAARAAEYNWRLPPPPAPLRDTPWVVSMTDRVLASIRSFTDLVGRLLDRFFSWLSDKLGGGPQQQNGALPVKGMHWTLYALIALVALAGVVVAIRMLRARRAKEAEDAADGAMTAIRLDAEDLTADRLPEEQWLALAERALAEQNLRLALRAFYLASLAWMGRSEYISIHAGKTNREYEMELKRRLRTFPEARALFGANVTAFERAWYGLHEVAVEEIGDFRARIGQMKSMLPVRGPAT
jgi:Domain of unknown function (DUF4129)